MPLIHRLSPLPLAFLALVANAQGTPPTEALPPVKVQGPRDDYRAPDTATANRTATPNLQRAQSVQAVTHAVLEGQRALQLGDALRP